MKRKVNTDLYPRPIIFNCYKPKDISSQDIVRTFKRHLPDGYGKIGHFGTLDPFARGVLMLGVRGAARLNNFIHEYLPKTYIADGILGKESLTGDTTEGITKEDSSDYLNTVIKDFSKEFIEQKIQEKFLGKYLQAAHIYSAAKYEGKALHEWARQGVHIKKEKKERMIYELEVVEYCFPKLSIKAKVSSGTYIRTLFSDIANYLGTLGVLEDLERVEVGGCSLDNVIKEPHFPKDKNEMILSRGLEVTDVLDFSTIIFDEKEAKLFINGVRLRENQIEKIIRASIDDNIYWVKDKALQVLGAAKIQEGLVVSEFIFT
ncbi:MAG: hypothetical protein N4A33_00415 [Bacteriovoracaceae bacterium]|jgi:tRNA pseudouridine55 synthase|nr:hypothetical protein [Bacteriovoracaceae bacterium]